MNSPHCIYPTRLSSNDETTAAQLDRFNLIRQNYRRYAQRVAAGDASWSRGDVYSIADFGTLFSPIESIAWGEIREYGLPLWPQFPVGRFFVDFGDPVRKIAIECDGAAFHDARKDAARDAELHNLGWEVYRVPGFVFHRNETTDERRCFGDLLHEIAMDYYPELPFAQCAPRHRGEMSP